MHTPPDPLPEPLFAQVRQLIHAARQRVAHAVNAELSTGSGVSTVGRGFYE